MKRPISTLSMTAVLITSIYGCAHEVKSMKKAAPLLNPVSISPTANLVEELAKQTAMMERASQRHVDVLAPIHFEEAKNYLTKANLENQKGLASEDVLRSLGYSKAYLNQANLQASKIEGQVSAITNAREQALKAGARKFSAKLTPLDNELKVIAALPADKVYGEQKKGLQGQYLQLELFSIKDTKLSNVQTLLNDAKTKGAAKTTPKAYEEAIQKFNIADKLIETDRHSNTKINKAVSTATVAAERVMNLLASEQSSRNQTPEQRAMVLESRDIALKQADTTLSNVAEEYIEKDQELAKQNANLALSQQQNDEYKRKESGDKLVIDAAAKFNKSEADVYRQGSSLIIRLKSINFASGRSDLPADSMTVLNKVKEVIKNIGPGQVSVEGHTDGIGAADINQKISQDRAQAVVKFFNSDKSLEDNKMDSAGFGYAKPLATNKTKEGRAQNRRVDIVIKPTQVL